MTTFWRYHPSEEGKFNVTDDFDELKIQYYLSRTSLGFWTGMSIKIHTVSEARHWINNYRFTNYEPVIWHTNKYFPVYFEEDACEDSWTDIANWFKKVKDVSPEAILGVTFEDTDMDAEMQDGYDFLRSVVNFTRTGKNIGIGLSSMDYLQKDHTDRRVIEDISRNTTNFRARNFEEFYYDVREAVECIEDFKYHHDSVWTAPNVDLNSTRPPLEIFGGPQCGALMPTVTPTLVVLFPSEEDYFRYRLTADSDTQTQFDVDRSGW